MMMIGKADEPSANTGSRLPSTALTMTMTMNERKGHSKGNKEDEEESMRGNKTELFSMI